MNWSRRRSPSIRITLGLATRRAGFFWLRGATTKPSPNSIALTAGMADAAGQISDNTLAQMGLAGLQTMSDVQATEIRGMGFGAITGAISYAAASNGSGSAQAAGGALASGKNGVAISVSAAAANVSGCVYGIHVSGPVAIGVSIGISGGGCRYGIRD